MKIAVACKGEDVYPHFGHCEGFSIYEAKDGEIAKEESVENPGHKPGFLPNFLGDMGVEVILADGIGEGAADICKDRGIKVITGVKGKAREAAKAYLRGELKSSRGVCRDHEYGEK